MKVISLADITCDLETEMLILTMYLKVFEKIKYFRKVFKYKYFSFLKVKYKYFKNKYLNTYVFDPMCCRLHTESPLNYSTCMLVISNFL